MAKIKSVFVCSECGYESPKWYGKCPSCGEWNTMNEELKDTSKTTITASKTRTVSSYTKPDSINEISTEDELRYDTGSKELNRVLGGGIVKGSLILLGGDPGIGKSTVLKVTAKEYKTQNLYSLNKSYTEKLLDYSEVQSNYNVPLFYGEIGVLRSLYGTNRNMEALSNDIISIMKENAHNYTWFTWHEPTFGIYTSSGLEPKNNPNKLLLEQIKEIYN